MREEWPGWTEATPEAMAPFVARLEAALEKPVSILSTGRGRADVYLMEPFGSSVRNGTPAC